MSFTASSRLSRAVALVVLVALAALPTAGCMSRSPDAGVDVITVIASSAGVNLNPYTNVLSSRQVGALLFRGMFAVDDTGMPVPDLALEVPTRENGGISADGTRVVYHLDPEAVWADGQPLTAEDVVFTWGLIASGELTDDPRGTANVVSVAAADARTVELTLRQPDAPFAWRFVPYVLPKHLLDGSTDVLSDDFWVHPVGSRGRTAQRAVKGTQVDLVDVAGVAPTIRVVFTNTDAGARGVWQSVDRCVWLDPPVGPAGAEEFSTVPGGRWQVFLMNPGAGRPTADRAVREAFAAVATVTVTPGSPGPYGLPLADSVMSDAAIRAALDDAGWRRGGDGTRRKRGDQLSVNVLFNPVSAEEGNRIEYEIGGAIKRFGGSVTPDATFSYTDYIGGSRLALGNFDVVLVEIPVGVPYGWAWPFESGDAPSESNPGGLNVARVSDAGLDAAAAAMREAGNTSELQAALRDAWARLEDLRLALWDVRLDETVLYKGLEGVAAAPFEEDALRSAGEWRIAVDGSGE